MKFVYLIALLFVSFDANAAVIDFYDHGASMNVQPVEAVYVSKDQIVLRSVIYACPYYPGFPEKIFGDVYECHTSRPQLSAYLNDLNILSLSDEDLSSYLKEIGVTVKCANKYKNTPLVKHKGRNVYRFIGSIL
jgi:hypothetical protein